MSNLKDKKLLKSCLMGCLILVGIGVVLVVGSVFGLRYWLHQSAIADLSPEEQVALKMFFEEPVDVPEQWRQAQPIRQELIDAADKIILTWQQISEDEKKSEWYELYNTLFLEGNLTEDQWRAVEKALAERAPVLKALDNLVSATDYEIEAFVVNDSANDLNILTKVGTASALYGLQAHFQAKNGEWDRASNSCLNALRVGRHQPTTPILYHSFASECVCIACFALHSIVQQCEDPEVLQKTLEELNKRESDANIYALGYELNIDYISTLRHGEKDGAPVVLYSGKTRSEYAHQFMSTEYKEIEWIFGLPDFFMRPIEEKLIARSADTLLNNRTGEDNLKVYYDLLRLSIVQRLRELKMEVPASTTEQWLNPFNKKPYLYHEEEQVYYSIGPDRIDNSLSIRYDPTNGNISNGDIWYQ